MVALGRYELLRPIAQGGMATVYLARVSGEGGFERRVAIKLMHPHIANERQFVTMFLDEARLAARIHHPNVVGTLAVERDEEGLFLVMEYVDGQPLHAILKTTARASQKIPLSIALRIMIDTLEGLNAAHELTDDSGTCLNLVHRDVSPQNVLIGYDGVARITDFGVAHARARLTSTEGASLKGKVAYLAPEQLTVGKVDRRSDLFAAGIVLWEMLTGRRLFRGETEGQTIAAILAGALHAPAETNPSVPLPISEVTMRALSTDPERRFASALEFSDALEAAARASGVAIAKPREVGAWVTGLAIPAPTLDGAEKARGSGSVPRSAPSVGSNASVAATMVEPPPNPPKKSRTLLGVVGVATGLGLVALALLLLRAHTAAPSAAPPPASVAVRPAAPPPPSATPAAVRSAEPPTSTEPSVNEAPSASAEPSASATRPRPIVRQLKRPVEKNTRPTATGYRPDEL